MIAENCSVARHLVGAGLAFPRAADSAAGEETSEAHSRIKKAGCGWAGHGTP